MTGFNVGRPKNCSREGKDPNCTYDMLQRVPEVMKAGLKDIVNQDDGELRVSCLECRSDITCLMGLKGRRKDKLRPTISTRESGQYL